MKTRAAFTLIELLIVVAIIALLAAIAIPNFLEAQTRAKVSRVVADMRTLAMMAEVYHVDNGSYPPYGHIYEDGTLQYPAIDNTGGVNDQMSFIGPCITTPIAYITSYLEDPFATHFIVTGAAATSEGNFYITKLEYLNMDQHVENFHRMGTWPPFAPQLLPAWGHWRMVGAGPDADRGQDVKYNKIYNPSNGTVSDGDIVRCQRFPESRYNPEHPD